MLGLSISSSSRVGCVRKKNEDMLLLDSEFVRDGKLAKGVDLEKKERYLLALADGMGGHLSGDVASSEVLHHLQFFFHDIPSGMNPSEFNEAICEWLSSISRLFDAKGRLDAKLHGMGTTMVALAYYNHEFYSLNCGDSRLYCLHDHELKQLTTDHSLGNLLGNHEHSSIITNCIGGGITESYIDVVQCTGEVVTADCMLLCSDGLSDLLSDDIICEMLQEGADAEKLCLAAEAVGGFDNVSAIVARII